MGDGDCQARAMSWVENVCKVHAILKQGIQEIAKQCAQAPAGFHNASSACK